MMSSMVLLFFLIGILEVSASFNSYKDTEIYRVDAEGGFGRKFDGIGAISGGGVSVHLRIGSCNGRSIVKWFLDMMNELLF